MRSAVPVFSVFALLVACGSPTQDYCESSADCTDPAKPYCDVHGDYQDEIGNTCIPSPVDGAVPDAPVGPDAAVVDAGPDDADAALIDAAVPDASVPDAMLPPDAMLLPDAAPIECTPSTTVCENDEVVVCSVSGQVQSQTDCPLGCHGALPRCLQIDPSNGVGVAYDDFPQPPDINFTPSSTIDTSTGEIKISGTTVVLPTMTVSQSGAPDIFVLRGKSVTISGLTVTGSLPLAIVADGVVRIDGELRVLAGVVNDCGAAVPNIAADNASACVARGGGGGGFGSVGGTGGAAVTSSKPKGGNIVGNDSLVPLRGGCGNAGGAVQIVSRDAVELTGAGYVNVNGRGGVNIAHYCSNGFAVYESHGGGSGGAVLLEAPSVTVAGSAAVAGNGGSGACWGKAGSEGLKSTAPVPGPSCGGGQGAALAGAGASAAGAGADQAGPTTASSSAAGGGGIGRIRVNTRGAVFDPAAGAVLSPLPKLGQVGVK